MLDRNNMACIYALEPRDPPTVQKNVFRIFIIVHCGTYKSLRHKQFAFNIKNFYLPN